MSPQGRHPCCPAHCAAQGCTDDGQPEACRECATERLFLAAFLEEHDPLTPRQIAQADRILAAWTCDDQIALDGSDEP